MSVAWMLTRKGYGTCMQRAGRLCSKRCRASSGKQQSRGAGGSTAQQACLSVEHSGLLLHNHGTTRYATPRTSVSHLHRPWQPLHCVAAGAHQPAVAAALQRQAPQASGLLPLLTAGPATS